MAAAGETPLGQAATECRVERNLLYEGKYLAMTVGQDNMEVEDLTCVLFALDAPREVLNSYVVEDLGDAKWGDYEASWRGDIYSRRLRITWTEP